MALTINQKPLYTLNPVGQELMFTIEDTAVVGTYYNVKYVAEVHIAETDIDLATSTAIGTFKTTPNNAGVGMFDFRPISESYVSPDNQGALGSEYKGDAATATTTHPLALIDKFSLNDNSVRYIKIKFSVEGATTATAIVLELDTEDSVQYTLINGYLKHTDVQDRDSSGNFGYNTQNFYFNKVLIPSDIPAKYLTNAPLTQYANDTDYGTVSFISTDNGAGNKLDKFTITYYQSNGTTIGTADEIDNTDANGGFTTFTTATKDQILHLGCYPANLRNWSTEFQGLLAAGTVTRYTVFGSNAAGNQITDLLYINLLCPNLKGFEPVRLKWLNQWGAWDYYTFKMKSTQSISTKGSTYQQLGGTWNESIYSPSGYKGGKKAFRVNATEKVVMNTEFVNQSEATWFEELVNSPEVYILDGFQTDTAIPLLSTYVTPVRLLTSNFTKKTVANDKLIQYTFEVEKSKTLRTQSV